MDTIDIVFRLAGVFYLFAGWFGLRAVLLDSVLDKALAALSAGKEDPSERRRRWIVGISTVVIGACGAALLLMSRWALPLFLLSTLAQAVWIAGARRFFISEEEDEETSRRQVVNAAIIYAAVTIGVVWLWREGRLLPWDEPLGVAGTALAASGLLIWFVYHMRWNAPSPGNFDPSAWQAEEGPMATSIVISPEQGFYPFIDADSGRRFSHFHRYEIDLAGRIEEWDDRFQNAFSFEDVPQGPDFASPEEEASWRMEAMAIAEALKEIHGAENVVFGESWGKPQGGAA